MPAAGTIDEAITYAADNIAVLSYAGVLSLYDQFQEWIDGMFSEATGIYPPSANPPQSGAAKQRVVTNWLASHLLAREQIEGTTAGSSGLVGTSAVIGAVTRVLSAVKFAAINGQITAGQQAATVVLFNIAWP
jgi:hypothetical protein